jgi:hypothetical protein
MPPVLSEGAAVPSILTAALLLVAIPLLDDLGLAHPTATEVLAVTKASRSRAYELRAVIDAALPTLQRSPGRPTRPSPEPTDTSAIMRAIRDFVFDHPGAVGGNGVRRRYSDDFRRFVLDLAEVHRDVSVHALVEAVGVPLGTFNDWLAGGIQATKAVDSLAAVPPSDPTEPQLETILATWRTWRGSFGAFCRHLQHDWRIPFGRTLIANILLGCGVRFARRRSGRSPDEDALRGKFETFFPNAQWVGDGSPIAVDVGDQTFTFNVELMVDPCSGAVTGASVRDNEDAAAVIEAFDDGVATTCTPPLAVLLDNKPSNHAEAVVDALGDTDIVRATPFRPQNKAHVEGIFGLFQQVAPVLAVSLRSPKEIAQQMLELVVMTWARTLNHRPRKDRDGRSRVELHLDHTPTPEEVDQARNALAERIRKQKLARETRAARQDPLVRSTVASALGRLGFDDPDGELLNAIARYPIDAVVEGIAIVEGKRRANTLPDGVDARYLLGCVRNVSHEREGWEIALALWDQRSRARDVALVAAETQRDRIAEDVHQVERRIAAYVDCALATSRLLDRFFWLTAVADTVLEEDDTVWNALFRLAARRIHAKHAVPHSDRISASRFLAARILPIGT